MVRDDSIGGPRRVFVVGASGTIGQAVVRCLIDGGCRAVAFMRHTDANAELAGSLREAGAAIEFGDVTNLKDLRDAFAGEAFDAVISCLASRTGAPAEAERLDFQANLDVLDAAEESGVRAFVLLSAICVQKPRLAFQHAKLRFERRLQVSSLDWTIVRPTAFFKSLSGQVERVKAGKPFLVFGSGELTQCKPISDADLARYIVSCLDDPAKRRKVLPIGGPGPAVSLKDQGEMLFKLSGQTPRYRSVSPALFRLAAKTLAPLAAISPWFAEKREYLRIAHYYATESMLVWDQGAGAYDAEATPEYGADTLRDHYAELISR